MSEVKVSELDQLISEIQEKRAISEAVKHELTQMNNEIGVLEQKAIAYLAELNRSSYKSPHGTIMVAEKWRFNLPNKDDGSMSKFFEYLRDKGVFEQYATLNSNSYNSLLLTEWEEAKKQGKGLEFSVPGVPEPKLHKQFSFRKG